MAALRRLAVLFCLFLSIGWPVARGETAQGVSRNEIVLGSILDLSGAMSSYGRQAKHGMQMRVTEINQEGGVNGRMLRLIVEDSGSDPDKATALAHKLIEHDQVFALIGDLGATSARAALPVALKKNVVNFLPMSSGRVMYDPPDRLKVAFVMSTADQLHTALPYLLSTHKYVQVCSIAEEGEYGAEIAAGTESSSGAPTHHGPDRMSYPHGTTDFTSVVQSLKRSNCDLVVIGGSIRDAVGVITEVRRENLNVDFLGTSALYSDLMHDWGGNAVEGMYAVNTVSQPYADDPSKLVRDWTAAYQTRFGETPSVYAVYGWVIVDLFSKAATHAGPLLDITSFNAALESTTFPRDMFGSPEFHVTSNDRLGSRKVRISRIVSGKWIAVSTLLDGPSP